jgi:hypothetical protein
MLVIGMLGRGKHVNGMLFIGIALLIDMFVNGMLVNGMLLNGMIVNAMLFCMIHHILH